MFRPLVLMMLIGASVSSPAGRLEEIFDLGKKGNVKKLCELTQRTKRPLERNALNIALYIASPQKFSKKFVDEFPQSSRELNEIYEEIELEKLTPEFLYTFRSLGRLANAGSVNAAKKIFGAIPLTDGVISTQLCSDANQLFETAPQVALTGLAAHPRSIRTKAYSCFLLLDEDEVERIRQAVERTPPVDSQREVRREILANLQ